MSSDSEEPGADTVDAFGQSSSAQPARQDDANIRLSIPVTVLLEQRLISRAFWSVPSWYLHTVAVGENVSVGEADSQARLADDRVAVGATDKGELFAWSGFEVKLYKDACERYWHALIGDNPLVYVICSDDGDGEGGGAQQLKPVSVSVDYDDASAAAETDVPVLSTPIPGELYRHMERFVVTHYKPQEFKKRKRRNWAEKESEAAAISNASESGPDKRTSGAKQSGEKQTRG